MASVSCVKRIGPFARMQNEPPVGITILDTNIEALAWAWIAWPTLEFDLRLEVLSAKDLFAQTDL
jgi:hypothetical protein